MGKVVAGKARLTINGEKVALKTDITYNLGIDKFELLPGSDEFAGAKIMPQASMVEFKITDDGLFDTAGVLALKNAQLFGQTANGKSFVMNDAFQTGSGNINPEEGTIDLKFESIRNIVETKAVG